MDNKMFCFQCEQAAHCTGCTGSAGVCGKSAETANLQDELTGALIGLARAADGSPGVNEGTWSLIIEALFTTLTNVNFDAAAIRDVTARVKAEKSSHRFVGSEYRMRFDASAHLKRTPTALSMRKRLLEVRRMRQTHCRMK